MTPQRELKRAKLTHLEILRYQVEHGRDPLPILRVQDPIQRRVVDTVAHVQDFLELQTSVGM